MEIIASRFEMNDELKSFVSFLGANLFLMIPYRNFIEFFTVIINSVETVGCRAKSNRIVFQEHEISYKKAIGCFFCISHRLALKGAGKRAMFGS